MLRVLDLHPTQRDIMDSFLARHDSMDAMDSVMDMMDDWDDRRWTMRPLHCLARRQRPCPYITPGWASLLDDAPLLFVRSGENTWSDKKSEKNKLEKQKITQNDKKSHTRTMKEKEQSAETTDRRECSNDKKSLEKVWRYSVDVGGCDEVRAFSEDGLLVVEGRGGDSDSSVMVRHVTTLPPHIKAETLTATQKDGRLVVSHKTDAIPPSVVKIPITKTEEKKTLEGKEVSDDQQQQESNTKQTEDSNND
ncbi:uncharacterized protein LOC125044221 [Penaeus chinensis]|uniref:uncharacterized protein LOC125044221 n=1 Tax=Penaeus chinensis TaxID=139456 RepID=UPI001FB85B1E|nr:uncharacterized protein LOC125044221 [Penaeus chinensis]